MLCQRLKTINDLKTRKSRHLLLHIVVNQVDDKLQKKTLLASNVTVASAEQKRLFRNFVRRQKRYTAFTQLLLVV